MAKTKGTIGILTGGGDVPGLNPAIRAITIRAVREGYDVIGIPDHPTLTSLNVLVNKFIMIRVNPTVCPKIAKVKHDWDTESPLEPKTNSVLENGQRELLVWLQSVFLF